MNEHIEDYNITCVYCGKDFTVKHYRTPKAARETIPATLSIALVDWNNWAETGPNDLCPTCMEEICGSHPFLAKIKKDFEAAKCSQQDS